MKRWGFNVPPIMWTQANLDKTLIGETQQVKFKGSSELGIRIVLNKTGLIDIKGEFENTVYHELAHAVAGMDCVHSERWQKVAEVIRERTGIKIDENMDPTTVPDEYWMQFKYVLHCNRCGLVVGFDEKNKTVRKPHEFVCGRCGGTLERIK